MIGNYIQVIHIIIKKKNTQETPTRVWKMTTQWPSNVSWESPKDPNVREHRRPSGDSQIGNTKIEIIEIIISEIIVLVLHICPYFLQEEQIFKKSKWWHPRDVCRIQLRDVPGNKWCDVLETSVGRWSNMFFKFNSQTH